mgnify:CR=1 FL=1
MVALRSAQAGPAQGVLEPGLVAAQQHGLEQAVAQRRVLRGQRAGGFEVSLGGGEPSHGKPGMGAAHQRPVIPWVEGRRLGAVARHEVEAVQGGVDLRRQQRYIMVARRVLGGAGQLAQGLVIAVEPVKQARALQALGRDAGQVRASAFKVPPPRLEPRRQRPEPWRPVQSPGFSQASQGLARLSGFRLHQGPHDRPGGRARSQPRDAAGEDRRALDIALLPKQPSAQDTRPGALRFGPGGGRQVGAGVLDEAAPQHELGARGTRTRLTRVSLHGFAQGGEGAVVVAQRGERHAAEEGVFRAAPGREALAVGRGERVLA